MVLKLYRLYHIYLFFFFLFILVRENAFLYIDFIEKRHVTHIDMSKWDHPPDSTSSLGI